MIDVFLVTVVIVSYFGEDTSQLTYVLGSLVYFAARVVVGMVGRDFRADEARILRAVSRHLPRFLRNTLLWAALWIEATFTKRRGGLMRIAARQRDATFLKSLFDAHEGLARAAVNCAESESLWTPLHIAAVEKSGECVKTLLANGAQPNATTRYANTPLDRAMIYGNDEACRVAWLLVSAGAKVVVAFAPGVHVTAFETAISQSNVRGIAVLCAVGNPDNRQNERHLSMIEAASQRGYADSAIALHQCGASVHAAAPLRRVTAISDFSHLRMAEAVQALMSLRPCDKLMV